jgi:hypothetical protein
MWQYVNAMKAKEQYNNTVSNIATPIIRNNVLYIRNVERGRLTEMQCFVKVESLKKDCLVHL